VADICGAPDGQTLRQALVVTTTKTGLWEYYDRRAAEGVRGFSNALAYWRGLGVTVSEEDIRAEAAELERRLQVLEPVSWVEIGAGPGTFTASLPGAGIAFDQSSAALQVLHGHLPSMTLVRGDAFALPFRDSSVGRVFAAHLYGLLEPVDARILVEEAHRVANELVVLDAGRPEGVPAAHVQERSLPGGGRYRVFRRHFTASELASEVNGRVLFAGRFYVMVAA
jgi:hypothetical protein